LLAETGTLLTFATFSFAGVAISALLWLRVGHDSESDRLL
jgi:hypothetical protein